MNLDLALVRTFVAIADGGGFSRAAAALRLSPPAVSLQMKRLEESLSRELFYKDGRSRELTEAGRAFLGFARKMLQVNDTACSEVGRHRLEGRIRIGATEDFAEDRLPTILRDFAQANPGVKFELLIDVNRKLHAALDAGALDIALIAQDLYAPREGALLFREDLIWIGPEGGALDLSRPLPLVLFNEPCLVREIVLRHLEAAHRDYEIVCVSSSLAGIRAAVRAGVGVTVRTRAQLERGLREIRVPALSVDLPRIDFCVFTRNRVASSDTLLLHMQRLFQRSFEGHRLNRVSL